MKSLKILLLIAPILFITNIDLANTKSTLKYTEVVRITPKKLKTFTLTKKCKSIFDKCELTGKSLRKNKKVIHRAIELSRKAVKGKKKVDLFLYEIAVVESDLGILSKFSLKGNRGKGPWQVDEVAFDATKKTDSYPILKEYHKRIKEELGVDWVNDVKWEHCNYAIYSCIAARLYLILMDLDVSDKQHDRAKMWKRYYNTHLGKGTEEGYLEKLSVFEEKFKKKHKKVS